MCERIEELAEGWRKRGYELSLGAGIAVGHATLGRIGFEGRYDYGALGTVTNIAARLSDEAAAGRSFSASGRMRRWKAACTPSRSRRCS